VHLDAESAQRDTLLVHEQVPVDAGVRVEV
jgi:hypothetical protein